MWQFNHIYIEKEIKDHPRTAEILKKCRSNGIFYIDRYMELFGRKKQDIHFQIEHRSLILAKASGELIYRGSPMCQDYGRREFYYTSLMKNCLYDCEYCFLKGMYDCGYLVIFVNIEDVFEAAEQKLAGISGRQTMYLSVSFDTDLFSFEKLTGYCRLWEEFASNHPECEIEVRTKGAPAFENFSTASNFIMAFTLSPTEIIEKFEHHTAPLEMRVNAANSAIEKNATVRLCIDPMIYVKNWRKDYAELVGQLATCVDLSKVRDFGIGTFRISKEYLKRLREAEPDSEAAQFPFVTEGGYAGYPQAIKEEMINFLMKELKNAGVPERKIFIS
ncbi:MAG: radical SAM protein [Lachnospiraceae bacterium]|uniref:Radical SAM protein n=1 Tax=Candidatus Weimeria bifida TaxID=2599074 RepID=A0A6N7J089_9FIRM|nr:radical SAM protein [Candidatus Weimeria bifida]RRF96790.1 MAG: radical SAM protein [Lachnospiraceae bacterium]